MLDLRNPLGVPPAALASDADLLQQYQQQVQAAAAAASTISTSALHGRSHGAAGGPFSPRGPSQPTTPATAAHAAVNALLGPSHNPLNPSHEAQELSHPISTGNESEAVTSHPLRQVSSSTTGELQGGSTQPAASTAQAGAGTTNTQSRLRQVSSGGAAGAGAERSSGALATSARGTRATSGMHQLCAERSCIIVNILQPFIAFSLQHKQLCFVKRHTCVYWMCQPVH
jgi:hypothetical protein